VCVCVCVHLLKATYVGKAHPSSFLSVLLSIVCTHTSPQRTVHRTHTGLSETWNLVYTVYPFSVLIKRVRAGDATWKLDHLKVTVQYIKHILKSSWLSLFHITLPACTLLINTLNGYKRKFHSPKTYYERGCKFSCTSLFVTLCRSRALKFVCLG